MSQLNSPIMIKLTVVMPSSVADGPWLSRAGDAVLAERVGVSIGCTAPASTRA